MGNLSRSSKRKRKFQLKNIHFQTNLNEAQSGFAALLVLVLLVSFSLFGMEVFIKANSEHRIVKREAERIQGVLIAEGGIEWAKGELMINPAWSGGIRKLDTGELEVSVSISSDGKGYWLISRARTGFAHRDIRVLLIQNEGTWEISSYEVLHS